MQKMKGTVSISSPNTPAGQTHVCITVRDEISHKNFLEIEITHEELMRGLMGLACRPCDFEVKHLDLLGKTRIDKRISILLTKDGFYKKEAEVLLLQARDNLRSETGKPWEVDLSLNQQSSFTYKDGERYVNSTAFYYE
jgi:hypothetical protein